jgi:hypothetical protein
MEKGVGKKKGNHGTAERPLKGVLYNLKGGKEKNGRGVSTHLWSTVKEKKSNVCKKRKEKDQIEEERKSLKWCALPSQWE